MKTLLSWAVTLGFLFIVLPTLTCCKKGDDIEGKSKKEVFVIEEATIAEIHMAFKKGQLTSRQLVDNYLERIEKYDQSSGLNSIVVVNPDARKRADYLDKTYSQTNKLRPQIQQGGMGLQSATHRKLHRRDNKKSLRPGAGTSWLERRHGGCSRSKLRDSGIGNGYGQLHSRPLFPLQFGGYPFHHGINQPGRHHSSLFPQRHRRTDGPDGRGRRENT